MPTTPELLNHISSIVAEVLGLDPDEVTPQQNFFKDLGGESIDILDLQFRVEKELGIRVQFQEMLSANRWVLDDQGRFTAETRMNLGDTFPFLKRPLENEQVQTPQDLLTIEAIAEFVEFAGKSSAIERS